MALEVLVVINSWLANLPQHPPSLSIIFRMLFTFLSSDSSLYWNRLQQIAYFSFTLQFFSAAHFILLSEISCWGGILIMFFSRCIWCVKWPKTWLDWLLFGSMFTSAVCSCVVCQLYECRSIIGQQKCKLCQCNIWRLFCMCTSVRMFAVNNTS